jgi:hypothetical protein
VSAAQTGVAMPARRKRAKPERWRQMSFNLADGFAAIETEDKTVGSKGAQPKMPAANRRQTAKVSGDADEMKPKAARAFAKQDNKGAKKPTAKRGK